MVVVMSWSHSIACKNIKHLYISGVSCQKNSFFHVSCVKHISCHSVQQDCSCVDSGISDVNQHRVPRV